MLSEQDHNKSQEFDEDLYRLYLKPAKDYASASKIKANQNISEFKHSEPFKHIVTKDFNPLPPVHFKISTINFIFLCIT